MTVHIFSFLSLIASRALTFLKSLKEESWPLLVSFTDWLIDLIWNKITLGIAFTFTIAALYTEGNDSRARRKTKSKSGSRRERRKKLLLVRFDINNQMESPWSVFDTKCTNKGLVASVKGKNLQNKVFVRVSKRLWFSYLLYQASHQESDEKDMVSVEATLVTHTPHTRHAIIIMLFSRLPVKSPLPYL